MRQGLWCGSACVFFCSCTTGAQQVLMGFGPSEGSAFKTSAHFLGRNASCVLLSSDTRSHLKLDNDTVNQQTRESNTATGCNIHRLTHAACEMMVCAAEKSWMSRMLLPWESSTPHKLAGVYLDDDNDVHYMKHTLVFVSTLVRTQTFSVHKHFGSWMAWFHAQHS